jgi:hypothetical protein
MDRNRRSRSPEYATGAFDAVDLPDPSCIEDGVVFLLLGVNKLSCFKDEVDHLIS